MSILAAGGVGYIGSHTCVELILFVCNLGTGNGYGVPNVLHTCEKADGHKLPYIINPRRPGDIAACCADPSRARTELGWTAELGIGEMCASSWKWQSMNLNGYKG